MTATRYTLLITDRQLQVLCDPIICWTSLDVTLRFNEPDSGIVVCPGYDWIRDVVMQPGRRVVMIREGQILTAGPIEDFTWEQADNGENAGDGVLTFNFADDFAGLAAREIYPDPAQPPTAQTPSTYNAVGNAETVLLNLVNLSGGIGALPARRIPRLTVAAPTGIGSTVTVAAQRMAHLGDVARSIADLGGGFGFRTRQAGDGIVFETYQPPDRSHEVRFGFSLGNMRYRSIKGSAPKCTTAIVGGQSDSDGAATAMIEVTDAAQEAAWGRFEQYVAQAGDQDAQVLTDYGNKALGEGAATTQIATSVSDTPDQRFGFEYGLGDVVSLEDGPGTETSQVVRTVHIQVNAGSGEYIAATVGNQEALTDPVWLAKIREIDARLSTVERAAVFAGNVTIPTP